MSDIENYNKLNILIVDDDDDLRETLADVLIFEGFENTFQAEDGQIAVETAKSQQLDLVISDLNMPGMDGIETIKKIKEFQPNVVSMILTGFGSMDVAIKAFSESKVDDFLSKPVENDELIEKIKLYLSKKDTSDTSDQPPENKTDMVRKDFGNTSNFLGQYLVDNNYITEENLINGLQEHKNSGKMLGLSLVDMNAITEDDLLKAISDFKGYPIAEERDFSVINEEILKMVSKDYAQEHQLIPLAVEGENIKVAMINPDDLLVIDTLKLLTNKSVIPFLASRELIEKAINEYYTKLESANKASSALSEIFSGDSIDIEDIAEKVESEEDADSAPIRQLVNSIIHKAVMDGISDIHIEPEEKFTKIRFRKDGRLFIPQEYAQLPKKLHNSLIARIKIMTSTMKIDVKLIPQDGKIRKIVQGREVDFRVASLPTIHDEKIVMRILDKSQNDRPVEVIFNNNPKYIEMFKKNIKRKDGMVLVTGPTGSGKTQTLAAAVNHIKSAEINIVTAEDPVEITNPGVIQVEIDNKQGRTFAAVLKQFLRQDPDVIMIGEMRDYETAHIGCESALTGHLVFSTLHTNDAPSAITRFTEMGIKAYLTATVVHLVVAQRLARTVCKMCKTEHKYEKHELESIGLTEEQMGNMTYYKGEGCANCKGTGQSGRVAIVEMLELTPKIRAAVTKGATAQEIGEVGKNEGTYYTLADDARDKFLKGLIDLHEAQKYTLL